MRMEKCLWTLVGQLIILKKHCQHEVIETIRMVKLVNLYKKRLIVALIIGPCDSESDPFVGIGNKLIISTLQTVPPKSSTFISTVWHVVSPLPRLFCE